LGYIKSMARGKTKGAGSFVTVSLKQLNTILRDEANVIVSRRFAETLGLGGIRIEGSPKSMETFGEQIELKETNLEEDIELKIENC
jgi:hypothetical protein